MSAAEKNHAAPAPLRPGARSQAHPTQEPGAGKIVAPVAGKRKKIDQHGQGIVHQGHRPPKAQAGRQRWNAARVHKVKFACALWSGLKQKAAAVAAGYKNGSGLEALASKLTRDPIVQAELERLAAEWRERAHAGRATKFAQGKQAQDPGATVLGLVKVNGNGNHPEKLSSASSSPPSFARVPAPKNGAGGIGLSRVQETTEGQPARRRPPI